MKRIIASIIVLVIAINASAISNDEKVLGMLKSLNQNKTVPGQVQQGALALPPPPPLASPMQQALAQKSEKFEAVNKETEMLGSRVQGDLAFEQKLPRAVGYTKIGEKASAVIDFSGKRFRLIAGDVMAGWTVVSIGQDGIRLKSRNGYAFKSYFDIK